MEREGKPARIPGSFSLLPLACNGCKQDCAHSSPEGSRFLTALLLVPLVFRLLKGTHLTSVGSPRAGVPNMWIEPLLSRKDI